MSPQIKIVLYTSLIAIFSYAPSLHAYSGQGSGTGEDPFLIANCVQLQEMQDSVTSSYKLANDIDCSDTVNWNGTKGFQPVGSSSNQFSGSFDGDGHTISDITILRADDLQAENAGDEEYVGIFAYTNNTTISNLNVTNSKIKGLRYVGGIAGFASNTTFTNVTFNKGVAANSCNPGYCVWARFGEYGGGIVGYSDESTFVHVEVGGSVKGSGNRIGGIIGQAGESSITHATSTASIDGGTYIGGIVGRAHSSVLSHVYSSGQIVVQYDDGKEGSIGGGIVGYAFYSTTTDAIAVGDISGFSDVGGIVGYAEQSYFALATSSADVTASNSGAGGFVGSTMTSFFSTTTSLGSVVAVVGAGGFVGYSRCESQYRNSRATGDVSADEIVGGFAGDDGCEGVGSTFIRSSATGMVSAVSGSGEYVGGFIGNSINSTITDSFATGQVQGKSFVGGFVGNAEGYADTGLYGGNIERSYSLGLVSGADGSTDVGGFVGAMSSQMRIADSFTRGQVTGTQSVGGFIGSMSAISRIEHSYSTGDVTGDTFAQGFVGLIPASETMFSENFWDAETSGYADDSLVSGLTVYATTTAAMKNQYTFINKDWDFATVWGQDDAQNNGYPYLYYMVNDTTAPILTTVSAIPSTVKISEAVYRFTINEACIPLATEPNVSPFVAVETQITNTGNPSRTHEITLNGIQVGGTYSVTVQCRDRAGNNSNTLFVGPFTVVLDSYVTPSQSSTGVSYGGSSGGGSYSTSMSQKAISIATSTASTTPVASSTPPTFVFKRNLKIGSVGVDVKELQKFLNTHGFIIAKQGAGSPGKETLVFGPATKKAVQAFQKAHAIKPQSGIFGPLTIQKIMSLK